MNANYNSLSAFGRQIMDVIISEYNQGNGTSGYNNLTPLFSHDDFSSKNSMGPPVTENYNPERATNKSYPNENYFESDDNFVSLLASQVEFSTETQVPSTTVRNDNANIIADPFWEEMFGENYIDKVDFDVNERNVDKENKPNEVTHSEINVSSKQNARNNFDNKNPLNEGVISRKNNAAINLTNDNLCTDYSKVDEKATNRQSSPINLVGDNLYTGIDEVTKFAVNRKSGSVNSKNDNLCNSDYNKKNFEKTTAVSDNVITSVQTKINLVLSKFAAPKKPRNTTYESKAPNSTVIMLDTLQVDLGKRNDNIDSNGMNGCIDFIESTEYLNNLSKDSKEIDKKLANYFPSQEVLSQKIWHLTRNPPNTSKTIASNSSKRKLKTDDQIKEKIAKQLYVVEVDTNKKAATKRMNQLKLSDMLPAKKNKNAINSKPKQINIKNNRVNQNVNQWLDTVNELVDNEIMNDLGLNDQDNIDKVLDDKLNAVIEAESGQTDNVLNEAASFNSVQTVLVNHNGKMSYKKDVSPPNKLTTTVVEHSATAKVKQIKSKFIPPSQRCVTKVNLNFDIKNLTENDIMNIKNMILSSDASAEIGFTIIFREGFCQMEQTPGSVEKSCIPNGILLYVGSSCGDPEYYFFNINGMAVSEKEPIKGFITQVMTSNIKKVCYEAQVLIMLLFDLFHYKREDVCLKWDIIDPKIGCFLLDPDNPPTSFSNVLAQLSLNKDFEFTNNCPKQKAAYYLSLMSKACERLYETLTENNLWKVFISMETTLITILAVMESRGICIDPTVLSELESVLNDKLKVIEKSTYKAAGKYFQLNSPMQLRKILFDELQLDVKHNITIKETLKLGVKSTSEAVLRSLVSLHPLPGLVLNHRNIYKAKATFVDAILQQCKNGIIRTSWEQTSAATGRIVSCNPNLQAFPKQPLVLELFPEEGFTSQCVPLRNAFIPRLGYTFVAADFQHIECRVFAHLTQDKVLIDNFMQDVDIFTALAMKWMNKKTPDEIMSEDRDKTKHLVYALMYGAGVQKLSEILNMEMSQTSNVISKFLATFPSLRTFKEKILKKCREQNGVLHSLYGRVRRFKNINSHDRMQRAYCERQAINFVIQGSAADLCKLAMIATEHRLSNLPQPLGHHLLLQIHDELVWEVPDDNVETFIEVVQEVMQHSGEFCGELSVPLPVSIVKGKSWGQMS